jgi:hypothetical protein
VSDRDTWLTPRHIVSALGPFDLDPCAAAHQPWPTATKHFTKTENGLRRRWHGLVWLNPPFSDILPWMRKLADLNNGIALIPVSTGAKYWQEIIFPCAICVFFVEKRLKFLNIKGESKFQSGFSVAFAAFGAAAAKRMTALERVDRVVDGAMIWL